MNDRQTAIKTALKSDTLKQDDAETIAQIMDLTEFLSDKAKKQLVLALQRQLFNAIEDEY